MTTHLPYLVAHPTGYIEYQLPVSVKLVIDTGGRVPLLRNERDEWELPGGRLEVGESPEEAVRREVREELGLTITKVTIIDTWVYQISPQIHVFIVTYGTNYTGDRRPVHSAEHKQLELFTYAQVPALHMPKPYKRSIARWATRHDPAPQQPIVPRGRPQMSPAGSRGPVVLDLEGLPLPSASGLRIARTTPGGAPEDR